MRAFRISVFAIVLVFFTSAYSRVTVTEGTTKLWLKDLRNEGKPVHPELTRFFMDVVYPHFRYPARDGAVPESTVTHVNVTLENPYLTHVQFPNMGGHVLVFRDRKTGKDIFHSPDRPVGHLNYLLTKGAHVGFPKTEHGFNSLEPWPYRIDRGRGGASTIFTCIDSATGLKMDWQTFMPDSGYYIDLTATASNPGKHAQRAAMFFLQQMRHMRDTRAYFPSPIVNVHTGFYFDTPKRRGLWDAFGRNAPIQYPIIDGVDLSDLRNFPIMQGIYMLNPRVGWCGLHSTSRKMGFVKLLDPDIQGVKFYGDQNILELFSGMSRSLSAYRTLAPGAKITLRERIIPTTGMTWLTKAFDHGVAGIYRKADSTTVVAEYLCADPTFWAGKPGRFSVYAGDTLLAQSDTFLRPSERMELRGRIAAGVSAVTLKLQSCTGRTVSITTPLDSIPVLAENSIAQPELSAIIEEQKLVEIGLSGAPLKPVRIRPDTVVACSLSRLATLGTPDTAKREETDGTIVENGMAATTIGNRLYTLGKGLQVFTDTTPGVLPDSTPCISGALWSPKPAERAPHKKVRLETHDWSGDIVRCDTMLALSIDKRVELRTREGQLLDSIALHTWPAGLLSLPGNRLLVALPYENALAQITLSDKKVTRIPLPRSLLLHPWCLSAFPGGIAVSSAVAKRVVGLSAELGNPRLLFEHHPEPLRTRYPGIVAMLWSEELKCFLISDPDNFAVKKYSSDGRFIGELAIRDSLGPIRAIARGIDPGPGTSVLLTLYSPVNFAPAWVYNCSTSGELVSTLSSERHGTGRIMNPFPSGKDKFIAYEEFRCSVSEYDTTNTVCRRNGGQGWGNGLGVCAGHGCYDKEIGYVVADGEKGSLIHYGADLSFVGEYRPPWKPFEFFPIGVTFDEKGSIHALESNSNAVALFTPNGTKRGYRFQKLYNLPRKDACAQRIYRQGSMVVIGDATGCMLYRFTCAGKLVDTIALPDSSFITAIHACGPDTALHILAPHRAELYSIARNGAVRRRQLGEIQWEIRTMVSLHDYPEWMLSKRPQRAAFACLTSNSSVRYLDSNLELITAKPKIPTVIERIEQLAICKEGLVAGHFDYPGVVVIDTTTGKVKRWVPLDIKARHVRLLEARNDSTFGAITHGPLRFVEFTLSGRIVSSFTPDWKDEFWNFAYTHRGTVLIPMIWDTTIAEYRTDGSLVKKRRFATKDNAVWPEGIVEGPDSLVYLLNWRDCRVSTMGVDDSVRVLVDGKIEGDKLNLDGGAWIEFVDKDRFAIGEVGNGRIHMFDKKGQYYGCFEGSKSGQWKWNTWHGVAEKPRRSLLFVGKNGIQRLHWTLMSVPTTSPTR